MEQKLYDAAASLPEPELAFENWKVPTRRSLPRPILAAALCLALLLCLGGGTLAYAAEAKAYNDALVFFNAHGLSTEGLSRGEVKAVYRDITTQSFTFSKTAQVINSNLSSETLEGFEIAQSAPAPEDVENLWNRWQTAALLDSQNIHYRDRADYKTDPELGFEVLDKSYLDKYEGDTLLWSVAFTEFWIEDHLPVSDGVLVWGRTYTWSSKQNTYPWLAKIDQDGNLQWKQMLSNGYADEYIAAALENADGSYAVFSRGDLKCFCLSQYAPDGTRLSFRETEVGNVGIWNAARFQEGYLVQLGNVTHGETARIVKVDPEGHITDSFSYSGKDAYYYLTDMIEYNGNVYLSAYAVPMPSGETGNAGGRYEIADVLDHLFSNNIWEISSEALTPMVRKNYTALLLICDPRSGTPLEFYSVEGSLGGKLAVSEEGALLWDVESIASTFFSPATSSFTIGGSCEVFRYRFGSDGLLLSQENTGETVPYHR